MSSVATVGSVNLSWDQQRGSMAMLFVIITEAGLFVALFFAYFYLSRSQASWPPDPPPKLTLAFIMLVVLLSSSAVLEWGKWQSRRGHPTRVRTGAAIAVILGLCFLGLQVMEYRDHLRTLKPQTDSYGSIFYTITSIHGLHVVVGLLMLCFVIVLPRLQPRRRMPYRPFHNASLYWHFVDCMWVLIVAILYVMPRFVQI